MKDRIGLILCVVVLVGGVALARPRLEIYSGGHAVLMEEVQEGDRTEMRGHPIEGLFWEASYTGLWDEDAAALSLSCQIKLTNLSGQEFQDTTVELVAGELFTPPGPPTGEEPIPPGAGEAQRFEIPGWEGPPVEEPPPGEPGGAYYYGPGERPEMPFMGPAPTVEGAPHRYLLPGPMDIPQGESFVPYGSDAPIPAQASLRLVEEAVETLVRFHNEIGHPLPPGLVQIRRPDGALIPAVFPCNGGRTGRRPPRWGWRWLNLVVNLW